MQKVDKRELILGSIIKAYLQDNLPIGSSELGLRMGYEIPASTIRVYFKKLSDEGVLTQLHVSGGRVPTDVALKYYWRERLSNLKLFNLSSERFELSDAFGIYSFVEKKDMCELKEIINVENRFLILSLTTDEIVLSYSKPLYRFLQGLIGIELSELKRVFSQVGLNSLIYKIDRTLNSRTVLKLSQMTLFDICGDDMALFQKILDANFLLRMQNGLYFDEFAGGGNMAIKTDVILHDEEVSMFCIGRLNCDFEGFFNYIKEVA